MIVGVDFGAPRRARDQRRKLIAIGAEPLGGGAYRVDASGMNARLFADGRPGWSARELADELLGRAARVVGFDFPFGVPHTLLHDPLFASAVGYEGGAFREWRSFNQWVARALPLTDPLDFSPFAPWRDPKERARLWSKRSTDVAAGAQPPLKDKFQATFQMTLLGNAVLSTLWQSGKYRVRPLTGGSGEGELIEVYPGATLRHLGLSGYKARPARAVSVAVAACAAAGISLEVDPRLIAVASRYNSGTARSPDYDVADAFVALCTALLHAAGATRPALAPAAPFDDARLPALEGAIWVPALASGL